MIIDPKTTRIEDGIVYIISCPDPDKNICTCDKRIICYEYDEPLRLEDISLTYPYVVLVIAEDWTYGLIYRYGNHKDKDGNNLWEEVGQTIGFA